MAMMKLKSVLIISIFLFLLPFIFGAGCPSIPCVTDDDCDDGRFCNGEERCVNDSCSAGYPPCARELCDEGLSKCTCWTYEDCDDGDLCTLDHCLVPDQTCFWLPAIECPEDEKCNPSTGECE